LVHDEAERELLKEVEVYQGVYALLVRSKEQAKEQLRYLILLQRLSSDLD